MHVERETSTTTEVAVVLQNEVELLSHPRYLIRASNGRLPQHHLLSLIRSDLQLSLQHFIAQLFTLWPGNTRDWHSVMAQTVGRPCASAGESFSLRVVRTTTLLSQLDSSFKTLSSKLNMILKIHY